MLRTIRLKDLSRRALIFQKSLPTRSWEISTLPVITQAQNYSTTFKSYLSLETLYPGSSLSNIAKTPPIPTVAENADKKFSGYIPMDKVKITHCKSSGPGGMNVNCVNTKVDIRFHLDSADWIPQLIRNNMKTQLRTSISRDGFFIITSDRTRFQHYNTADALEKLRELIRSCEPVENPEPSLETLEKLRRRRDKAARERLRQKQGRSMTKESRGAV